MERWETGPKWLLIVCFIVLSVLLSSVFHRWMWTTQRRLYPSVTTPSQLHWPVLRCALPLRKFGVSCDQQTMSNRTFFPRTRNGHHGNVGQTVHLTAIMRGLQTLPCSVLYVNTCTVVFGYPEDSKEVSVFGVSFHVKAWLYFWPLSLPSVA